MHGASSRRADLPACVISWRRSLALGLRAACPLWWARRAWGWRGRAWIGGSRSARAEIGRRAPVPRDWSAEAPVELALLRKGQAPDPQPHAVWIRH
jgi:hypothetical protein